MEYSESLYHELVFRLEELDTLICMSQMDNDDLRRLYDHVSKALDIAYGLVCDEEECA